MENENEQPQVVEETPVAEETTQELEQQLDGIPQEETVTLSKSDYNKLTRRAIAYETVKKSPKQETPVGNNLDSVDLIKLGKKLQDYSDDELDFVTEFAKSKKPEDILKALENPFVKQGIDAYREKSEKEKLSLTPSGTQPESDRPKSLSQKLADARTNDEKAKILEEAGLYNEPKYRPDRVIIRP